MTFLIFILIFIPAISFCMDDMIFLPAQAFVANKPAPEIIIKEPCRATHYTGRLANLNDKN